LRPLCFHAVTQAFRLIADMDICCAEQDIAPSVSPSAALRRDGRSEPGTTVTDTSYANADIGAHVVAA